MTDDMMEEEIIPKETSSKMDEILNSEPEAEDFSTDETEEDGDDTVSTETDDTTDDTDDSEPVEKAPAKAEQSSKEEEPEDSDYKDIEIELDEELVDPQISKAIKTIAGTLNEERKKIAADRKTLRLEREKAFENRIDSVFDKYSEDLPELGTTSSITKESGNYRREIFLHAKLTADMKGISIEDAIARGDTFGITE